MKNRYCPCKLTRTRDPLPCATVAPSALKRLSMSDQAISDRVGRAKIASSVRRCLPFMLHDIAP